MAGGLNGFRLGCAAEGAGVGLYAGLFAGSRGSDLALVPYVVADLAALSIETEAEVLLRCTGSAGVVCGEAALLSVPLQVDLLILARQLSIGDKVAAVGLIAKDQFPLVGMSCFYEQVCIGAVKICTQLSSAVGEGVGAVLVDLNGPNHGGICGLNDVAHIGQIYACNVVAAHNVGDSLAVACIVNNNLVPVLGSSGQIVSTGRSLSAAGANAVIAVGVLAGGSQLRKSALAANGTGNGLLTVAAAGGSQGNDLFICVLAGSRNGFRPGLAAEGANVGEGAVCYTGRLLGQGAFIPHVVTGLRNGGPDDLCKLGTGSRTLGVQLALGAVDDTGTDSPCEGLFCIAGNGSRIGEGVDIALTLGLAVVTPHHSHQLFTGDLLVGTELGCGNTVNHPGLLCPCNRVSIPVGSQVGEGSGAAYRGLICHTVQDRNDLGTGTGAFGIKLICFYALHEAGFIHSLNILSVPGVILHILEGAYVGRKHGRHNAENHNHCQKQSNDSLDRVFHVVSSFDFQKFGV